MFQKVKVKLKNAQSWTDGRKLMTSFTKCVCVTVYVTRNILKDLKTCREVSEEPVVSGSISQHIHPSPKIQQSLLVMNSSCQVVAAIGQPGKRLGDLPGPRMVSPSSLGLFQCPYHVILNIIAIVCFGICQFPIILLPLNFSGSIYSSRLILNIFSTSKYSRFLKILWSMLSTLYCTYIEVKLPS